MKHLVLLLLLPFAALCDDFTRVTLSGRINWTGDTTVPTLSSATVSTDGTTLTLVFSEAVSRGAGWTTGDIDVDGSTSGDNLAWTYSSGDGTTTLVGTLSATVYSAETLNLDFNGDANSIEDAASNDVAAISNGAVTNNSTQSGYLVNQNFEGTGYDNGETWTETGTVNEDYTTSPAPLAGSQSLRVATAGNSVSTTFSSSTDCYSKWMVNVDSLAASTWVGSIYNATNGICLRVRFMTDGSVRVYDDVSNTASGTGVVAAATTYYVWARYQAGTGANAVATVWVSTSDSRPGTATAQRTAGAGTTGATRIVFEGNTSPIIVDAVKVDDALITP